MDPLCYPFVFKTETEENSQVCRFLPSGIQEKIQLRSFLDFADRYLALSDKIYVGEAAINSDPPAADYYITGSDQVWAGTLPANFLTFVGDDTRKIAYAVSFGRDELQVEHANTIRPWIGKFDKISVRENRVSTFVITCAGKALYMFLIRPCLSTRKSILPQISGWQIIFSVIS